MLERLLAALVGVILIALPFMAHSYPELFPLGSPQWVITMLGGIFGVTGIGYVLVDVRRRRRAHSAELNKKGEAFKRLYAFPVDPHAGTQLVYGALMQDPATAEYLRAEHEELKSNYVAAALAEAGEGSEAISVTDGLDCGGNTMFWVLVREAAGDEVWYLVTITETLRGYAPE